MTDSGSATIKDFRARAERAIADPFLQNAIDLSTLRKRERRLETLAELPDAEAMRDQLKLIRSSTLAQLADYLEMFERNATAAGAQVHWARDAAEANRITIEIAKAHGVSLAVKSKSMATEEIHLNHALEQAGITPVETDLGEWIIQLAGEMPSHIVGPALHKTRAQCAELLSREVGHTLDPDDIPAMTAAARLVLREKFLAAGVGITGANIGVAETGSIVLVTNEGNGRLVTSAPPVHIAIIGIEKIAPNWDAAAVWLSLLARSATGVPLSIYTAAVTGTARPGDPDGPQEMHIILLDNGRSRQLGTPYEEVLQCIRCGACLNSCPVYQEAGGHAYGHAYSGPIGAVVVPVLFGLKGNEALPQASSLCGACLEVCPVRIDLPRMLLALRADIVKERVLPAHERWLEGAVAYVLRHGWLYRNLTRLARIGQIPLAHGGKLRIPRRLNPAGERDLPVLAKRPFRALWDDIKDQN